eukprot:s2889_g12.t1
MDKDAAFQEYRYASAVVGRLLHPVSSAAAVSRGPDGYRDTFHEAAPVGSCDPSVDGLSDPNSMRIQQILKEEAQFLLEDDPELATEEIRIINKVKKMMNTPEDEKVLQTKIISPREVARNWPEWLDAVKAEVESLTLEKEALRRLTDEEHDELKMAICRQTDQQTAVPPPGDLTDANRLWWEAWGDRASGRNRQADRNQSRNRRGYRSVARTIARANRGQDRRAATAWEQQQQASAAAQPEPAQSARPVQPEPSQPEPAHPEPAQPEPTLEPVQAEPAAEPDSQVTQPEVQAEPEAPTEEPAPVAADIPRTDPLSGLRVTIGVRSERVEPPEGKPALEAVEETRVILVPKKERARKAYVEKSLAEAKEILDEPSPQVPQELLDEVDFEGDISSEESFEILPFPRDPIKEYYEEQKIKEESKGETTAASSSTTGLAAPPLYAAGIPRAQPSPSVEAQLDTALELCDKIQGALSQQPEPPLAGITTSPKQTVQQDGSAGNRADPTADGGSSESGASVNYRATESNASKRAAAARERGPRATPPGQGQPPQQSAGSSAAGRPVSHIDVLKAVKQPQSLKDREQWERFSFQLETYLALLNEEFPDELHEARKST